MKKTIEHYIEFSLSDDSLFSQPIKSRRVPNKIPSGVVCYRYFDRLIVISRSTKAVGKPEKISKWIKL